MAAMRRGAEGVAINAMAGIGGCEAPRCELADIFMAIIARFSEFCNRICSFLAVWMTICPIVEGCIKHNNSRRDFSAVVTAAEREGLQSESLIKAKTPHQMGNEAFCLAIGEVRDTGGNETQTAGGVQSPALGALQLRCPRGPSRRNSLALTR